MMIQTHLGAAKLHLCYSNVMCAVFSALSSSAFPAPPPMVATPGPSLSLCFAGFSFSFFLWLCLLWALGAPFAPFAVLLFPALVHLSIDVAGALGSYSGTLMEHRVTALYCFCVFPCCLLLVRLVFSLEGRDVNTAPL